MIKLNNGEVVRALEKGLFHKFDGAAAMLGWGDHYLAGTLWIVRERAYIVGAGEGAGAAWDLWVLPEEFTLEVVVQKDDEIDFYEEMEKTP